MTRRTRTGTLLMAAGLATGLLASCGTGAGAFERALVDQAEQGGGTVSFPAQGAPLEQWERVVIVCPYMYVPDELDPEFAKAITNTDEFLDESSQWLIFAQQQDTKMMRLSRDTIDFCSDGLSTDPLDSGQLWSAVAGDESWILTPIQ